MIDVIIMAIAVLLIILTLLQSGKSDGVSSAFTGGSSGDLNLFSNVKERGPEKVLAQLTMGLGFLFFLLIIVLRLIK